LRRNTVRYPCGGSASRNAFQESAVADLTKLGPVSGYPLDVTDRESFATFLDKARTDGGGRIDVLINNAGVMPIGPFLDQSEQTIRSTIEVNFYGVLNGCRLVLPDMVKRRVPIIGPNRQTSNGDARQLIYGAAVTEAIRYRAMA